MPNARNALTLATTPAAAAQPVCPPSWLTTWEPDQIPPATVDQIAAEVERHTAALVPVDRRTLLVVADPVLALFPMPDNWEDQAQAWYAALYDIPEDLIRSAFERVARNCRFWPRPAEVRAQIAQELMERKVAANRLRVALTKAKREVEDEARRKRRAAEIAAAPVSHRDLPATRMPKLTDLPVDELVVTPEEAAAKVAEWGDALGRTACKAGA
jgi:hypothetical protein